MDFTFVLTWSLTGNFFFRIEPFSTVFEVRERFRWNELGYKAAPSLCRNRKSKALGQGSSKD